MPRPGRKRKPGVPRHPCGKIRPEARERQPNPTLAAKAYRMAHGATAENWTHTEHETPLGRLYIAGAFNSRDNPDQAKSWYEAGIWFARLWRAANSAIDAKAPHARAPGSAGGIGPEPEEGNLLARIARHRAAERVLTRLEIMAVWEIIVVEREGDHAWLVPHLVSGLPKLVRVRGGG
jgi:hypothetical protein